eukprot:6199355-Pleurochrysis_carterae.AAC.1
MDLTLNAVQVSKTHYDPNAREFHKQGRRKKGMCVWPVAMGRRPSILACACARLAVSLLGDGGVQRARVAREPAVGALLLPAKPVGAKPRQRARRERLVHVERGASLRVAHRVSVHVDKGRRRAPLLLLRTVERSLLRHHDAAVPSAPRVAAAVELRHGVRAHDTPCGAKRVRICRRIEQIRIRMRARWRSETPRRHAMSTGGAVADMPTGDEVSRGAGHTARVRLLRFKDAAAQACPKRALQQNDTAQDAIAHALCVVRAHAGRLMLARVNKLVDPARQREAVGGGEVARRRCAR